MDINDHLLFSFSALSPVERGAGENPFNTNVETSKISDQQSRQTTQPPLDQEQPFVSPTDLRKLPAHIHPNSKEVYPMFSKPRGIALIINIKIIFFHNLQNTQKEEEKGQLVNRLGSDKDIEMLEKLFGALDFKVKIERNLKQEEIYNVLHNISCEDHSNYDCFVLCLMSHGLDGFVYGADGERVFLDTVRNLFSNSRCSTLKGKPKLFVIQANRNNGVVNGNPQIIPDEADMLMAYSTVSGHVSFRNLRYGSHFIRCLVEVFREKAGHEDVLSMLTMVNDSISSMGEVYFKQVGQPTSTLTKKLFFWPGL